MCVDDQWRRFSKKRRHFFYAWFSFKRSARWPVAAPTPVPVADGHMGGC
jgi:hypothetical protein